MNEEAARIHMRMSMLKAFEKYQSQEILSALEQQIVSVILSHPDLKLFFSQGEKCIDFECAPFDLAQNPFFHIALHLSLFDQVNFDRPAGIKAIYEMLIKQFQNETTAQHAMMACLQQTLQTALQTRSEPDELAYLQAVRKLVTG